MLTSRQRISSASDGMRRWRHSRDMRAGREVQWLAGRIQTSACTNTWGFGDGSKAGTYRAMRSPAYLPHFLALTARASSGAGTTPGSPGAGPSSSAAAYFGPRAWRTGVSSRTTWTRCCAPVPSGASRRCGGTSGRTLISARSRSGCLTACPRCARSAWSRRCRSLWFSCSTPSSTAVTRCRAPAAWVVRDNKWRATRYGLDAMVITDDYGSTAPLRDELYELVHELEPVATGWAAPTSWPWRSTCSTTARPTSGSGRWWPAAAELPDVVDALAAEFAEDRFVCPGRQRMAEHDLDGELDAFLAGHEAELIEFRRDLHAHPETGYHEYRTTRRIALRLEAAGLRPTILPKGTGLTVDIGAGSADEPVVALRADIDALPINDEKDVPYRSGQPGRVPRLRARRAHLDPARHRPVPGQGRGGQGAARQGPADLPARRGSAGRRDRRDGGRRHRLGGPDLRAALRPAARRRQDRHQGRARSPRRATSSRSR